MGDGEMGRGGEGSLEMGEEGLREEEGRRRERLRKQGVHHIEDSSGGLAPVDSRVKASRSSLQLWLFAKTYYLHLDNVFTPQPGRQATDNPPPRAPGTKAKLGCSWPRLAWDATGSGPSRLSSTHLFPLCLRQPPNEACTRPT